MERWFMNCSNANGGKVGEAGRKLSIGKGKAVSRASKIKLSAPHSLVAGVALFVSVACVYKR